MTQTVYLFTDIETPGLGKMQFHIIEMAMVITTEDLIEIGRLHHIVSLKDLPYTGEWDYFGQDVHKENGLIAEAKESTLTHADIDELFSRFIEDTLKENNLEGAKTTLAGSGVHFDKEIIRERLPKTFVKITNHQLFCTSAIKHLFTVGTLPNDNGITLIDTMKNDLQLEYTHRALPDILLSLKEMFWFRRFMFNAQTAFNKLREINKT